MIQINSETRKNAREAFEVFRLSWPQNASNVYSQLPTNVMNSISNSSKFKHPVKEEKFNCQSLKIKKAFFDISEESNLQEDLKYTHSPRALKAKAPALIAQMNTFKVKTTKLHSKFGVSRKAPRKVS